MASSPTCGAPRRGSSEAGLAEGLDEGLGNEGLETGTAARPPGRGP